MMKECAKHCSIMQWSRYGFPVDTALHKTHTNTHGGGKRQCHSSISTQGVITVGNVMRVKKEQNMLHTLLLTTTHMHAAIHAVTRHPTIPTCGWLDARRSVPRGSWRRGGWGGGDDGSGTAGVAPWLGALLVWFLLLHPGELVGNRAGRGDRGRGGGLAGRVWLLGGSVMRLEAISGGVSPVLLASRSWSRLAGCAGAEAGDGVLKGRRNYCRLLDWWSLKWLQDGGEGRQALC